MTRQAVTSARMQELDRRAIEEIGIPVVCLMENAGRAVADEVLRCLRGMANRRVCLVCGGGNNGGDGFVAARHLVNHGVRASIVFTGDEARLSQASRINLKVARNLRIPVLTVQTGLGAIGRAGVIVDALFGTGLQRPLTGPILALIGTINAARAPVLAVDLPSGLDGTTGRVWGACVRADVTVTMAFVKTGLLRGEGPRYAGRVVVADIGIPYCVVR